MRNPEDSFYKRFAAECSRVHICIDVYSFCKQYSDLASVLSLPKYTGGQVTVLQNGIQHHWTFLRFIDILDLYRSEMAVDCITTSFGISLGIQRGKVSCDYDAARVSH